jgi:hypothetical protein
VRDYLQKWYPERRLAPLSKEAADENPQQVFDASNAEKMFGMKFRTFEELLKDYVDFAYSYGE